MKTTGTVLLAILLSLGFAVTSFASIADSSHDLSHLSTTGKGNQICVYCHTPHFKGTTLTYPLWSATVQTDTGFTAYTSPTLEASITDPLVGPSRLCMSCHDGSIAIDSALAGNTIISGHLIGAGGDLTSDHPIGFDYTAVAGLAPGEDAEIKEETELYVGTQTIADFLFEGTTMTCASCHDVHEQGGTLQNPGSFLVMGNSGSALCLACHDK